MLIHVIVLPVACLTLFAGFGIGNAASADLRAVLPVGSTFATLAFTLIEALPRAERL